jgi:hypothetical protein
MKITIYVFLLLILVFAVLTCQSPKGRRLMEAFKAADSAGPLDVGAVNQSMATTDYPIVGRTRMIEPYTSCNQSFNPYVLLRSIPVIGGRYDVDFVLDMARAETDPYIYPEAWLLISSTINGFFNGRPLPVDLTDFGADRCRLLLPIESVVPLPSSGIDLGWISRGINAQVAQMKLPIPESVDLLGFMFYFQVVVSTAKNKAGLALGAGYEATIGLSGDHIIALRCNPSRSSVANAVRGNR